jgi:exodeoxyribonuclease VII large subunit
MFVQTQAQVLTVAEVVGAIRLLIERQFAAPVWIEGELSNCSYPASGHIYFTLVDEKATDRFGQRVVLPCAFFRGANQSLRFRLEDGQKVLVLGQIATYESRGQYQVRVMRVEPKGAGALQLAFEQLKKRLAAEGLFDEARKRPLPRVPEVIGVVTSATGSAVHDMVDKLRGRFQVRILPVKVQGEGAAQEIAGAIALANHFKLVDVLIVGRGGGSVEDLWAFNEEPVARAIAASRIPIISAVGHEDDWTIADYVADVRASTPTEAAERLAFDQQVLIDQVHDWVRHLNDVMEATLAGYQQQLRELMARLRLLHPRLLLNTLRQRVMQLLQHSQQATAYALEREQQRLKQLNLALVQAMRHRLERDAHRLQHGVGRLQALSPLAVLGRGYSITFSVAQQRVVRCVEQLQPGDTIETKLSDGSVKSLVQSVTRVTSAVE